jgi:phospholipase C
VDPKRPDIEIPKQSSLSSRTNAAFAPNLDVPFGLRVPTFLISPYVEAGSVFKQKLDHTSIIKSILLRFCNQTRPFISDRVEYANSFGGALRSEPKTKVTNSPALPTLPDMRSSTRNKNLTLNSKFEPMTKAKLHGEDADFHEFMSFLRRTVKPL